MWQTCFMTDGMSANRLLPVALLFAGCASSPGNRFAVIGSAELLAPGAVSTAPSEGRLPTSPGGKRRLWGVLEWPAGPGGWEIVESVRQPNGDWSAPQPGSLDSKGNDFGASLG